MTGRILAFMAAVDVIILDRISKVVAAANLEPGRGIEVIPGALHITLVRNTGAAFGMFKGCTWAFSVISVIVILAITAYLIKNKAVGRMTALSLGLIMGGAIGNLIDRLWLGYVIDFIDLRVWPVFNIADSCITVGTVILAINILSQKPKAKS